MPRSAIPLVWNRLIAFGPLLCCICKFDCYSDHRLCRMTRLNLFEDQYTSIRSMSSISKLTTQRTTFCVWNLSTEIKKNIDWMFTVSRHMEMSPLPVKGCKIKANARRSGSLSSEGSISCNTCCDTWPQFFRSHPKDRPILSPLTAHKGIWRIYSIHWMSLTKNILQHRRNDNPNVMHQLLNLHALYILIGWNIASEFWRIKKIQVSSMIQQNAPIDPSCT
jgi:hypothetical protein